VERASDALTTPVVTVCESPKGPDRDHALADHEIGRAPERDEGQGGARLDPDHGDVGVGVGADQGRVELALVARVT